MGESNNLLDQDQVCMTPYLLNLFENLNLDLDLKINLKNNLDDYFLLEAILEARQAFGVSSPNPPVGAVIVQNNKIVARGHTSEYGSNHGEVNAILDAQKKNINLKNKSTIYVSLEPCTHYGKTPPCINKIKEVGISQIVYASKDFNLDKQNLDSDLISQTKNKKLIELANLLIEPFKQKIVYSKPYVLAKIATTENGDIAILDNTDNLKNEKLNKKQAFITGLETKRIVHGLRYFSDAIFVGESTNVIDNPRLTVRNFKKDLNDFEREQKFINPEKYVLESRKINNKIKNNLKIFLENLSQAGHLTVMCEPGAKLFRSLFDNNLIDELWWFVSKKKLPDNSYNLFEKICDLNKKESFEEELKNKFKITQKIKNRSLGSDVLLVAKKI